MLSTGRSLMMRLSLAVFFMVATSAAEVISPTGMWRYLPGRAEASSPDPTAWRALEFVDSGSASGRAPFYFGEPFTGTEIGDMLNGYSSLYLRHEFTIEDPNTVGEMIVRVLHRRRFRGMAERPEIGRHNVAEGELPSTALASAALPEPIAEEEISVPEPWKLLAPGKNVLAIHAFNSAISSPDFALSASAEMVRDTAGPVVLERVPPAGSTVDELIEAEVVFSEPVSGVEAGDFLIDGVEATSVRRVSPNNFAFSFAQPAAGPVEFGCGVRARDY